MPNQECYNFAHQNELDLEKQNAIKTQGIKSIHKNIQAEDKSRWKAPGDHNYIHRGQWIVMRKMGRKESQCFSNGFGL